MIKYTLVVALFLLGSCGSSKELQKSNDLLKLLELSQKNYYNNVIKDNADFTNLLNFSGKGRSRLYKQNEIEIGTFKRLIILEGYSNGWGDYTGFLITDVGSWFYSKSNISTWSFKKIDLTDNGFEKTTSFAPEILNNILAWDTAHINSLKKEVGNTVHDGSIFWAIKVDNIQSKPSIENYTFYEYPVR